MMHHFVRCRSFAAMLAAALLGAGFARADDIVATWDDSHWVEGDGTILATFPNNDTPPGATYALVLNGGSVSLGGIAPTVNGLTWTGGAFSSPGITRDGDTVTGGQLTVQNTAALSGDLQLNSAFLVLNGITTIGAGGASTLAGQTPGSQIFNNGTLTLSHTAVQGSFFLFNTGRLDISSADNVSLSGLAIQNSGALVLHSGEAFTLDGDSAGSFSLDGGSALSLGNNGNFTAASSISGAGDVVVDQAHVTVRGAYALSGNTRVTGGDGELRVYSAATTGGLSVTDGFAGGPGSMTAAGAVSLNHGTLSFLGGLTANAGITVAPSVSTLGGHVLNPAGQLFALGDSTHATTLTLASAAVVSNAGTLTAGPGIVLASGATMPVLANSGVLVVQAPGDVLSLADSLSDTDARLAFSNSGDVYVNAGQFNLAASGSLTLGGNFHVAAGATLGLGADYSVTGTLTGAGNLLISTALTPTNFGTVPWRGLNAVTINGNDSLTGDTTIANVAVSFNAATTLHNLSVTSGTLGGSGTLTLVGDAVFSLGTVQVAGVIVNGTLAIGSNLQTTPTFDTTAVTVASGGSMTVSNMATFVLKGHASITNSGLLTFTNVQSVTASSFGSLQNPGGTITNEGTINLPTSTAFSSSVTFNNQGTINITHGSFQLAARGTDSADAAINVSSGAFFLGGVRDLLAGSLTNAGQIWVSSGTSTMTIGAGVTFANSGTLLVRNGTLVLAAAQQTESNGIFDAESGATLDFAASYDFSVAGDPTLTGGGLVIIDPGVTLTLAVDSAFAGTIQDNGTLVLAPARDPAHAGAVPAFTVLPAAVPEAGTLLLCVPAAGLLVGRRRRRAP
jgi:hypothetical protein